MSCGILSVSESGSLKRPPGGDELLCHTSWGNRL